MSLQDARSHLEALARLGADPAGVHIGGGEPFGDYPLLVSIVRAAREAGLAALGYVETNGYWAADAATVRARLLELRDAGMMQISISADVFHQVYVDPACVARLWETARVTLGDGGLRARRWRFLQAPQDLRQADESARRAAYRAALAARGERMTGRAARELAPLLPRRPPESFSGDSCGRALRESGHVHIDHHGNVFPGTCAGLVLGRASARRPLDEVLAGPRRLIWRTLVEGGPWALARLAEDEGFQLDPRGYADKCHLCTAVRTHLASRRRHGDELGPPELYAENPTA
jgi:hypothetical protein